MAEYLVVKCPGNEFARTNKVYVHPNDPLAGAEYVSVTCVVTGRTVEYYFAVDTHPGVQLDGMQAQQRPGVHALALNGTQRTQFSLDQGDLRPLHVKPVQLPRSGKATLANITVSTLKRRPLAYKAELDAVRITSRLMQLLDGQPFSPGQVHVFDVDGANWEFQFASLVTPANDDADVAVLGPDTSFLYTSDQQNLVITGQAVMNNLFKNNNIDLESLGIGGLDTQFEVIFRRAFASRCYPPETVRKYGIKHVKGMLLYGPPGTGKTLIARQIGKMLNAKEPKVVNGPEVLNKYVGQTEENIRALFAEAEVDEAKLADQSPLHIIIFDEIDAICKQRGSVSSGTGVHDTLVNQLLTKIDGVNALNNVLLIGMTNRKDMLDEALLRPGRLEAHVEVGLPDEKGRVQILNIHTAQMRAHGTLGPDVNVGALARQTKNFSGAEIEGLCRSAAQHALVRNFNMADMGADGAVAMGELPAVYMQDFERAFEEIKPQFGSQVEDLQLLYRYGMYDYGDGYRHVREFLTSQVQAVLDSTEFDLRTCLLTGVRGAGKTALAVNIAVEMGVPFVKVISPQLLVGYGEPQKCQQLVKLFEDAYKSPHAILILDDLQGLMDYVEIGPRFSNAVLQTILALVRKQPPKGHKLVVFGTMESRPLARQTGLAAAFGCSKGVHALDKTEAAAVLVAMGAIDASDSVQASTAIPAEHVPVAWLVETAKLCQTKYGSSVIQLTNWCAEVALSDISERMAMVGFD